MKRKLLFAALCVVSVLGLRAQRDVTSTYITNATLSDGTNGWTKTHTKTTTTNDPADAFSNSVRGNNTVGYASEAYAGWGSLIQTAYSMKQTITLPVGNYRLVCYAFFRQGAAYNTNSSKSLAKLVAGTNEVALKTLGSITAPGYANTQAEGANCFDSKMYRNVVEFTSDGTPIEIGVEGTFDEAKSWCIVGMFELFDLDDLASVSSPTDVTYAITNPGFEYRDLTGWTNTGLKYQNNDWANKAGIGFAEQWANNVALGSGKSMTQTLHNMPAGLYELSVYAQNIEQYNSNAAGTGMFLKANSDQTEITSFGQYKVRTTLATDGDLTIGINLDNCTGNWIAFDRFGLQFYGDPLAAYQDLLDAAVADAQAYIAGSPALSLAHLAALQSIVDANDNDDKAFTEESQFNTAIQTIENAVANYKAMVAPYAEFNALTLAANAIASVEYTETVSDSHTTFTSAITSQASVADNAATVAAINTAIANLKAAIKTYITGAEPKNEGEYFDITCLMANPDFSDNTITGWTKVSSMNPNTRIQCNEFFGKAAFDFYQTVEGLPNGSYTLSMKAFQRPGGYDEVYEAYAAGTNNATAKVYVNSDESDIMNIMQEMDETRIYTDPNGADAFNSDKQPKGATGFIPNSMEGAAAWFVAGKYQTEVAALVEDGTLRLGFKDDEHSSDVWTLFDEFRLHYYGSSKLIYLKQYLPQLKTEVAADLANGAYANVLTSSEDEALDAALAANPATETEEAYQTTIDNLKAAQTNFRAAATSYDAMVAAKAGAVLTKISGNIGTGVFQYNETTNNTLYSAYETAKANVDNYTFSTASTAAEAQALVDACNTAVDNYNNQALNAPETGKRYNVAIVEDGKAWNGNAITFVAGARTDMGLYGIKYLTPANANMNQALMFTPVAGETNTYKVSAINVETGGEQYITTGTTYPDVEGNNNDQIRTTDDASKAMWVKVEATATNGQFQLRNMSANKVIANNNNNDMYTANTCNFTIAEATQASVPVTVAAGKYATRIFPFTPSAIDGIKYYSCDAVDGSTLALAEVANPEANKPYILLASKDVDVTLEGWGTAAADSYTDTDGLLTGVYTDANVPVGSYVLQTQNGTQGFYRVVEAASAVPYRAYLTISGGGEVNVYNFGDTDKIDAVAAENAENAAIYNLAGQRVQKAVKGIYIVSGKKVILK